QARYGLPRPEVMSAFGPAAFELSGWQYLLDLRDIAPGEHKLTVRARADTDETAVATCRILVEPKPVLGALYETNPADMWQASQATTYQVRLVNLGSQRWNASGPNPVRLGVHFALESDVLDRGWATDQRFELPRDVPPE